MVTVPIEVQLVTVVVPLSVITGEKLMIVGGACVGVFRESALAKEPTLIAPSVEEKAENVYVVPYTRRTHKKVRERRQATAEEVLAAVGHLGKITGRGLSMHLGFDCSRALSSLRRDGKLDFYRLPGDKGRQVYSLPT